MTKNNNRTHIHRLPTEAHTQLIDSLQDLISDANRFDHGDLRAIKRSAVTLRTLYYDKNKSHSLLKEIGDKQYIKFLSYSNPVKKDVYYFGNLFVAVFMTRAIGKYAYRYLFFPEKTATFKNLNFDSWWNGEVIRMHSNDLTREKFIKIMANEDGGAHFDSKINEEYANLRDGNTGVIIQAGNTSSSSMLLGNNDTNMVKPKNIELAIMRQIVHESIVSLIRWYRLPIEYKPDFNYLWQRKINAIGFHFSAKNK